MDPEDLREVISAYQKCVAETVRRFGGFVAKFMGDGVLAYFGYPEAHEDDAEGAVRAGLELIGAITALKAPVSLQTRVGIATGLVVVGDLVGSGEAQERGIVGETPNLAARLQGVAEPNTVVTAESTRKLLGNLFEFEDIGTKDLKGIAGPVRAWAALRPASVESRFEALHASGLTALVGREEELDILLRRWSRAKNGQGQVVLLSGEAGIGKSRLTAALLESVAPEPHTRLRYFCSPQRTDSALYPIISQMERAAGFKHADAPQAKLGKLDAVLALTSTSKQDAALFAEMLSLPNDGRYPTLDLTSEQRRQKTLEAFAAQLEVLSRSNPVLMILEDVHWSDPTSLEAFDRVVDRIQTLRVLLLATFRPEFTPPWIGRSYVAALTINRLTRCEVDALIDRVIGNKQLPSGVRRDIIEHTDGIPLFIEEMTKAVLEATSDSAAEHAATAVPAPVPIVPASLHASLLARLDRLGSAKEVAQVGAAIGREFPYELIAAVADRSEDALRVGLDRLVDAGLVFRRGSLPEATFLFKHALVQDAAYMTLLKNRRRHLHARIAQMVEERTPDRASTHPELVASHYAQAGLAEKAIDYWEKAGRLAVQRSTMAEAAAHFGKALESLASLPKASQRRSSELGLQLKLAGTLTAVKGWASREAGEAYAHARELCRDIPEGPELAAALNGLRSNLLNRAEFAAARQVAEEQLALAERQDNSDAKVTAHYGYGVILLFQAEFARALQQLTQAIAVHTPPVNRSHILMPVDPSVGGRSFAAWALLMLGYPDQALVLSGQAIASARELGYPYTVAYSFHVNCIFHQLLGDATTVRGRSEELVALATEQGFPHFVGSGTYFRGWATMALGGSIQDAIDEMQQGLATKRATGAEIKVPYYFGLLAEAYRRTNRTTEGLIQLSEAFELVERTDERWYEGELQRLRGEMLIATADRRGAEPCFSRALATAQKQGAKFFELRAATSLARLWRDQGKVPEARALLAPVYGWFTEGFDTRDLKEAKALLEELKV
jgi:class 3 adenylate cyclase/predicted ATPase